MKNMMNFMMMATEIATGRSGRIMRYDEMISQLKDLLHDRYSFVRGDETDDINEYFMKDIQALQMAIAHLDKKHRVAEWVLISIIYVIIMIVVFIIMFH